MSDASPSFSLPACPVCSTRMGLTRPMWRYAHNTSSKRGVRCYFWSGCQHAEQVAPNTKLHSGAEEFAEVEAAWVAETERLLGEKTAHWTEAQRESWRTFLAAFI
ncbi:MAG TPA: hypothetical protein VNB29_10945 [Chthoniobacterales bacterium]|jgi:hypothetical protein|nr:hypothetical protein [Chthoniobacterales bacterium]